MRATSFPPQGFFTKGTDVANHQYLSCMWSLRDIDLQYYYRIQVPNIIIYIVIDIIISSFIFPVDLQRWGTQLTQWIPLLPLPSRDTITLITFGVSVGEGLLVALDTAHVLHVAKMIHDADGVQVKDIMVSLIFVESPITSIGEPSILPCSVAVRCGVLCFVEAPNLEAHKRTLHIWQLASEGEILPVPRRQTFQFFTRGQAAVSVPKPIFGRFVILKNCCMMEDGEPLLWIEILDIRQIRQEQEKHPKLRKLDKPSGLYQVLTSARDSTLFRRGHPLTDFLLGFWNEEPDTCFRKLLLVNLARAEDCQKCGAESQPGSTQSGSLESSPCGKWAFGFWVCFGCL